MLTPAQLVPESIKIQIVAGNGNDTIDLLQYRGEMVVLGGAGVDTVNVGNRNLLNGIHGTLTYDGDADIVELRRQATSLDFGNILNNLPNVFVQTDPSAVGSVPYAIIDRSGKVFVFTNPVLASIVFGSLDSPQIHLSGDPLVSGDLLVRAVALHGVNVQELGVHERGIQKITETGAPLWLGLDGNETINAAATGIPVIVRVDGTTGGQLVYLDTDGNRVFTNTGRASIVAPIGGEVGVLVWRDTQGRKTLTNTGKQSWQFLKGDLIADLVHMLGSPEKGVREYGVQKSNVFGSLWVGLNGYETNNATETGIPAIRTVNKGGAALPVYLNADGLRVFTVTPIPSIVSSNGVDTPTDIYVDVAGNLYLSQGAPADGRRKSFVADFENGVPLYIDQNGLKTDVLDAIVTPGAGAGVDLVVYAANTHDFTGVVVQACVLSVALVESCVTLTPTTAVTIQGDDGFTGSRKGYAVTANASRIRVSGPAGFLLDAIGIVFASRGSEGVAFGSIIVDTTVSVALPADGGSVAASGIPDGIGYALGTNRSVTFQAMSPALVPANRTTIVPFIRSFDTYVSYAGVDHLNILGGATTAVVNGTLDLTQVAVPNLNGVDLQYHAGTRTERLTAAGSQITTSADVVDAGSLTIIRLDTHAVVTGWTLGVNLRTVTGLPNVQLLVVYALEKQYYIGGEQVYEVELLINDRGEQDARLVPVYHENGDLVFNVITGAAVYGWDGLQLTHTTLDPVLHFRGEAVIHYAAEIRRYLGGKLDTNTLLPTGEPIIDENGNVVLNGDGSIFVASPEQGQIHNREELRFDAVVFRTNSAVDVSSPTYFAVGVFDFTDFLGGLAVTTNTGTGAAAFGASDGIVNVIARSRYGTFVVRSGDWSFDLAARRLMVDLSGSYLIGPNSYTAAQIGPVWLEASTKVQRFHVLGDEVLYFGDEAVDNGQPVVGADGEPVTVDDGVGGIVYVLWTNNPSDPGIALGTRKYVLTTNGNTIFHRRGEPVFLMVTGVPVLQEHTGGEAMLRLGNEARRWFGGEQAYYSATDVKEIGTPTYRIDLDGALTAPILFRNLDDLVVVIGSGNDIFEVRATHTGETVIDTGAGNDSIDVFSTSGNTTILAGAGSADVVRVGGLPVGYAGPGVQTTPVKHLLDSIHGVLIVTGAESLIGDDRDDASGNVGIITDTSVTGLGMGPQSEIQQVRIDADVGGFTLTFEGQTTAVIPLTTFADGAGGQLPTADAVRQALAGLSTIGIGNVEVTLAIDTYTIRLINDLAGVNVGQITIGAGGLTRLGDPTLVTTAATTMLHGADPTAPFPWNEHQIISVLAAFRLWFRGSTTTVLTPNSSAAAVEAALLLLPEFDLGDVSVTKLGVGLFGIDFRGQYAGLQIEHITVLDDTNAFVTTRIDGIEYRGVQSLTLDTGSGADFVIITSTSNVTTTATVRTLAGADTVVIETVDGATSLMVETGTDLDTVVVRGADSTLNGVDGALTIDAGSPGYLLGSAQRDRLSVFDEGETLDNTGVLTASRITGLDMTAGITYTSFEHLELFLGRRDDTLLMSGTHEGFTLVNGGPRLDRIDVESTSGETRIEGDGGDDFINVNLRPTQPIGGDQIGNTPNDNTSGDDTLDLDGGAGSDTYVIRMAGVGSSLINAFDSGAPDDGADTLTINGTPHADLFLMRASKTGPRTAFVALLNGAEPYTLYERVNYDENIDGGLTVNGLEDDDRFMVDDNAARTTLNGGTGDDEFQFAQVYETRRNGGAGVTAGDVFATIETTRGFLSNGVTFDTTANGGTGEDLFRVFHNLATLNLNGGFGDDTFIVKAFALVGSQDNLRERDSVDISGDEGADLIQYAVNAPVNINGGEGFDTVIIIGTEFGDDFVITANGVFGAGIKVSYIAVEKLTVDGAEGDDRFYVLGTSPTVTTELFGGLGSDAVFVGGDVNPVVANDLLGHSGLIEHLVIVTGAADPTFAGIDVEGVAVNVSDDEEPFVRIIQTQGNTTVVEGQSALGFDQYQVVLTRRPDRDVTITVAVDAPSPEEAARGARSVSLSKTVFSLRIITGGSGLNLTIAGHGFQTGDLVLYDRRGVGDDISGLVDGTVYVVSVIDANTIQLKPSANDGPIAITFNAGALHTLLPAAAQIQLVFTISNWSTPQTVFVASLDDVAAEGQHFASIGHSVLSRDIAVGLVSSTPSSTFIVIPVSATVDGVVRALTIAELVGSRIEIVRGAKVVRTRIVSAVLNAGGTTYTLTVLDPWPAGSTPILGDQFRITLDDTVRGVVTSTVLDTIFADNVNLGVLGDTEIGQQLVLNGYVRIGTFTSKIVWATRDSLTLADPLPAGLVPGVMFEIVDSGGFLLVLRDAGGQPIGAFTANGTPLPNTISNAVITRVGTSSIADTAATYTNLVGASVEIVGGTGVGERRTIITHTGTQLVLSRPWDEAPSAGSAYEIRRYDSLAVRAVGVVIEDNDAAGVGVVVSGTDTRVTEGAPVGHPGAADTYQVVLTRQPTATVRVTIRTDGETRVRIFGSADPFVTQLELVFTAANWNVPLTIEVQAFDDSTIEGPQIQTIEHVVTSLPETDTYPTRVDTILAPTEVSTILLSERPRVGGTITVAPQGGPTVQLLTIGADVVGGSYFLSVGGERTRRIRFDANEADIEALLEELITVGNVTVARIGTGLMFSITFVTPALAVVADGASLIAGVTVTIDDALTIETLLPGRFVLEENTLTFRGAANGDVEYRLGTIVVTYQYRAPGFHQIGAPSIDVRVDDNEVIVGRNDVPSVLVFETDGSTDVTEWNTAVNGAAPAWTTDTYQIVLSRALAAGSSVTVTSISVPTRTSRGELVYVALQLVLTGGAVTFTSANWWIPQTVTVTAVNDLVVDGSDTQAFAHRFQTATGVRGPLIIDGAGGGGSLELPPVVMLPHETNQRTPQGQITDVSVDGLQVTVLTSSLDPLINHLGRTIELLDSDPSALFRRIVAVTTSGLNTIFTLNRSFGIDPISGPGVRGFVIRRESANFFVDENEQIDSLTVLHDDAVRDEPSTLTATRITGLGMGGDRTIGGRRQPGGITYTGLEELDLRLGKGDDTLTIESTHAGLTRVDLGRGEDTVYVRTTNGHTTILGGEDDDLVVVASTRPLFGVDLVDFVRGLLTFDGGTGSDRLLVNDSNELADNTVGVTKSIVSGLDMSTVNEVQTVTVRAAGGTFMLTYNGASTIALAYDATAAQVQAALEAITAIGAGNVKVTKTGVAGSGVGSILIVRFRGGLTGTDVLQLGINGAALAPPVLGTGTIPTPGAVPTATTATRFEGTPTGVTNEVQIIEIDGATGSFTLIATAYSDLLGIDVQYVTGFLPVTATVAQVQAALLGLGLFSAGDLQVGDYETAADGSRRLWVRFGGAFEGTDVRQLRTGGDGGAFVWTLVEGTSDAVVDDVMTVTVAGGDAFRLALRDGAGILLPGTRWTSNLTASMSADEVEDALQIALLNSRFELDIVVERFVGDGGVVFTVYFHGVYRDSRGGTGVPLFSVQIDGTGTTVDVDSLMDGIQYFGLETLDIDMGAGTDIVNVRGTTAVTSIRLDAANQNTVPMGEIESIYVSSDADLDVTIQVGFDLLSGDLENIKGRLDLDAGAGRHRLWISDEADTTGDVAAITDVIAPILDRRIAPEITVTGLAPAQIGYRSNLQTDTGNFAGGVTVWTGRGNETITVDGTHTRNGTNPDPDGTPLRTVTTLNTGPGIDTVNVSLNTSDGFFVVNTQSGDDTVDADGVGALVATTLPIIVFGGEGNDTIWSGLGNDILFGDLGRVHYRNAANQLVARFGGGGPGDLTDGVVRDPNLLFNAILTTGNDGMQRDDEPTDTSANDRVAGNLGNDIILGGGNGGTVVPAEFLTGDQGDDIILGDYGQVVWTVGADRVGVPTTIESIDTHLGGADTIAGNDHSDLIVGGAAGDTIAGGTTRVDAADTEDVILGDSGVIELWSRNEGFTPTSKLALRVRSVESTTPGIGGIDVITGGNKDDVIVGGQSGDTIYGDANDDVILGDSGVVVWALVSGAVGGMVVSVTATAPGVGGIDVIQGNDASDLIIGGTGGDTIDGGTTRAEATDAEDVIAGDDAEFLLFGPAVVVDLSVPNATRMQSLRTLDPSDGGVDTITGGNTDDVIVGGALGDFLYGDANDDTIVGDYADLIWTRASAVRSYLTSITSVVSGAGGADTIEGNGASDIVVGGRDADTIWGGTGVTGDLDADDVLAGDYVDVTLFAPTHPSVTSARNLAHRVARVVTVFNNIGGNDQVVGADNDDVVIGGALDDRLDGNRGRDLVFGDNVDIDRRVSFDVFVSPRFQSLLSATLYVTVPGPTPGTMVIVPNLASLSRLDPHLDPAWGDYLITLLDHSLAVELAPNDRFGNDRIVGGSNDDMIFGQLGNDVIEGDGTITRTVGDDATPTGLLVSVEDFAGTGGGLDGDDYIEGNGGNDVIFGGLGQDDIVGGSSNRYGLTTPAMRPDGVDRIYGGAGTDVSRDNPGQTDTDRHARDADTILGDNGLITRVVLSGSAATRSAFARFTYDTTDPVARGTLRLIPRVVSHLDYSPWGEATYSADAADTGNPSPAIVVAVPYSITRAPLNIGGGDFIHGESGDDQIHGMGGTDTLFGDGQDDDIYGQAGWDWISGGTGDDGILGDDGLLSTSRNGQPEVMWGVTTANVQVVIAVPGNLQTATVYVTNELRKEADLVPFWIGNNDIVYGGRGNDFIHGGVGDDALSGAEALPLYYDTGRDPIAVLTALAAFLVTAGGTWKYTIGDILRHDLPQVGEFDAYDEFDPWRKVMLISATTGTIIPYPAIGGQPLDFLLNFATRDAGSVVINDGKDTIFGDVGDDWIVGGTNQDRLWGGWGDDLLQSDDDLDSTRAAADIYANNDPDVATAVTFADIAYGGAGRDILIGNTGADRMIDWVGEWNSYVVPFSPFGAFTISRQISPALQQYLLDLSKADGGDRTRGPLEALTTTGRQGEPYGEIALVNQKDPFWQAQTGAPGDPQPGNDTGKRDVLRTEDFTAGATLFAAATGTWTVINGKYQSAATRSTDAVSIFYVDSFLPRKFEIVASVFADKATGGFQSNGYVVLDYQNTTNFKFAGIDTVRDKVQIGKRTASGWQVLAEVPMQLLDNRTYEIKVAVDGTRVTVFVDGVQKVTYLFDATLVDPNNPDAGFLDPLTDGYLGLGAVESIGGTTSFRVQVPTPEITLSVTDEFNGSSNLIGGSGVWAPGVGTLVGTATIGVPAVSLTRFEVAPSARAELETVVRTGTTAGIAFDAAGALHYKFVAISPSTSEVLFGHYTGAGWVIDGRVTVTGGIAPNVDHILKVVLLGNVATVWLDGIKVAVRSWASLLNDGDVGLVVQGGSATFGSITTATDDPDLRGTALPNVTIGDATVVEGTGGSRTVNVTVTLSAAAVTPVTVNFETLDASALAGSDYTTSIGTVTFAAGETSKVLTFTINTDASFEGDETFLVRLTSAAGAIVIDNTAIVTITNDDAPSTPTVTVANVTVDEGTSGPSTIRLTFTLSSAPTQTVSVAYATADGTATQPGDYTGTSGTVTFAAGVTSIEVVLSALGDQLFEANETFAVLLSNAVGLAIGTPTVSVTINNDDAAPIVSVTATDGAGSEAGTGTMTFALTRTDNLSGEIVVALTLGGTAGYSVDYTVTSVNGGTWNLANRTVTMAAGVSSATVTVTPVNDTLPEFDETVTVTVAGGAGYLVGTPSTATATIVDNDQLLPALTVIDTSIVEGDKGQVNVVVMIRLSVAPTSNVSVTVRTVDGTAVSGVDYRSVNTTVTFSAGQTQMTINVQVLGDRTREGNETFTVELINPVGAAMADSLGVITIIDNDGSAFAARLPAAAVNEAALDPVVVARLLESAAVIWRADGLADRLFGGVHVVVDDLPFGQLARTEGATITIDIDAAGWGWFVDSTPGDAAEFVSGGAAAGRIDLLTLLAHELGHVLGLEHADNREFTIMGAEIEAGIRTLPEPHGVSVAVLDRFVTDQPVVRSSLAVEPITVALSAAMSASSATVPRSAHLRTSEMARALTPNDRELSWPSTAPTVGTIQRSSLPGAAELIGLLLAMIALMINLGRTRRCRSRWVG